jgi:membrane-bound ClpP family serine protease
MSILFRRKAIIPVWALVLGLVALFEWPMTWATGVLLLLVGVVPMAVLLILSREPSLTVAEVLQHAETSKPE